MIAFFSIFELTFCTIQITKTLVSNWNLRACSDDRNPAANSNQQSDVAKH